MCCVKKEMSSPSETRSQGSFQSSSQYATGGALEDTASSVHKGAIVQGSHVTESRRAPNSAFSHGRTAARTRSASPGPRRSPSPIGVSVAKRRAQMAERVTESAISGVGQVADEVRKARMEAAAAAAEAESAKGTIRSQAASLSAHAEASAAKAVEVMEGRVQQLAHESGVHTSCVAEEVTQRLEAEINTAATSTAATAQTQMREAVDVMRRELQAQMEQNLAESRRKEQEAQETVKKIASELEQLTKQLNQFKPVREADAVARETQLSSDVDARLQLQVQRVDNLTESVHKVQEDTVNNAETLQTLLISMENLGEHFRELHDDVVAVKFTERPRASEEDRVHDELNAKLLQEVSLSFPIVPESSPAVSATIMPTMSIPQPAVNPDLSQPSFSFSPAVDKKLQARMAKLRAGSQTMPEISAGFSFGQNSIGQEKGSPRLFNMGSVPSTYPGLDGHPRRITPIPMTTAQSSGNSQSTIGNTSISTREAEIIRKEVRDAVKRVFPGINFVTKEQVESGTGNSHTSVIDLTKDSGESLQTSAPLTIAGSDVSVASTVPSPKDGGKAAVFSRLSQGTDAASAPQMFATTQWKPKEPPCYYGRSTEDVHTWTSLVRHCLTFMGGSDAQQVAYSVTLLRDSAHEWYIGYERRNRHPPRDWAQLCDLLLERFRSNIRSQEAQSTLMAISQGQRLVWDYASQFETLLGRLDSYDESMMLNQFIWGLQPELARSVSLQYPKSIAQAVSLAETTELAVKASRRPTGKSGSSSTNTNRGPMNQNRGRGSWTRGRGRSGGF